MPFDIDSWTPRRRWCALLGVMLSLAALLYCLPSSRRHNNAMDIDTAIRSPHTLCVGRYLIDVPANYKLEHYDYRVNGIAFSWIHQAKDVAGFESALAERIAQLSTEKNGYDKRSLEEPLDIPLNGMRAIVLPYGRRPPTYWYEGGKRVESSEFFKTEAWLWSGSQAFRLYAEDMSPGEAQEAVIQAVKTIKPLLPQSTPNEAGFCMEMFDARAMLVGPPEPPPTSESLEIQFGLKDRPDVKFRLDFTPTSDRKTEPFSSRHARSKAEMSSVAWRISTLREGSRSLGPMEGYEVVEAFREENFTRGLSFDWEWLGRPHDAFAPEIHLEAKTGYSKNGPVASSLSDEDALKLWDMVANSIRLRPTVAPPKPVSISAPLGELAATGRLCPQTGWWECVEATVPGAERRHLTEGQKMPRVAKYAQPTLLKKLRGTQPVYEAPTMWRLAEYGELPPPVPPAPTADAPEGDA